MNRKLALIAVCLLACSRERPRTTDQLAAQVASARRQASEARSRHDTRQADKLGKRIEKLASYRAELCASSPPGCDQVDNDLVEAHRLVRLAQEDEMLKDRMGSLTVRGYRAGRATMLAGLCRALAAACEQPEPSAGAAQGMVSEAARLGELLVSLADGRGDGGVALSRAETAVRLRTLADRPPAELQALLALGWIAAGKPRLALVETETPSSDPHVGPILTGLRAFALSSDGLSALAYEESQRVDAAALGLPAGGQWLAGLHVMMAYAQFRDRDLRGADHQLALALRAWPDCPLEHFWQSETLLAEHKYAEAAADLDSRRDKVPVWLVAMLVERAQQVRQQKGEAGQLFVDPIFISRLVARSLTETGQAATASQITRTCDGARSLVQRLGL
jgi:hypothetical protein